ncbi:MAG TPA: (2Fe-2S)-binding protein [Acidimicrobiales bacterium]|nr:(2Fe-2S)-binding protein [Acidimicrobiales bacterium]
MFVCHCRAVTDGTVRATIAQGACSLRDLAQDCGAGSRCGGCHLVLQRMLADAGLLQPDTVPAAGYCAA